MTFDPGLSWSSSEKRVARAAFDIALAREHASLRTEVERLLQGSKDDRVVWDVLEFLRGKQRDIERKYDYRYSVLLDVFAVLLHEGWIAEEDLTGLRPEKLEIIRRRAGK